MIPVFSMPICAITPSASLVALVRDRIAELGGGIDQPLPEAGGEAAGNDELVGWRFVDLPKLRTDVGNGRDGRIAGTKCPRVQIDRHALRQDVPRSRACHPDDGAAIRLIADRGEIVQRNAQAPLECGTVLAV